LAGDTAAEIHCGQGLFIVGGTMRVKGKAEIRSICAVFCKGASIANVIILGMKLALYRRWLALALGGSVALSSSAFALQRPLSEVESLKQQAHSALATGQWDIAIQDYEEAIALAPKDANLHVELGVVLTKTGRLPDSIAMFQEALRLAPRNLAAELGLSRAYRAVHNYDEAGRGLKLAIREHPESAEPLAALGDFEIQQQTYDVAISHLKASLALAPANVETRTLLAGAYRAKGDLVNALAELQKVLARDSKNVLAYFLRAEIYSDQNRDELALPDARKVVELQPEKARGRILLAKILVRTPQGSSKEEAAKRCSEAVATLEPVESAQSSAATIDSETYFLLARAYRCAGQPEQAEKADAEFEAASQKERGAKENETQAAHLVKQADEAALKNDLPGAFDLLQQALAKDPNSGAAYSMLAKLYYSEGEIDKASEAITKAIELAPHQPDFLYVRGKIEEKQEKLDEALASFRETTLINPQESDAYFEIGVIYQQRKDLPRAMAAYKKAVEIAPQDPDYRRALASIPNGAPISSGPKVAR
jgi:tetratricopeptide (TPR) repeat protein